MGLNKIFVIVVMTIAGIFILSFISGQVYAPPPIASNETEEIPIRGGGGGGGISLECSNGIDDDGDGYIDMDDLGCESLLGTSEGAGIEGCRTNFSEIDGNLVLNPHMECGDTSPTYWVGDGDWGDYAPHGKVLYSYNNSDSDTIGDWSQVITDLEPDSWYELSFKMLGTDIEPTFNDKKIPREYIFWSGFRASMVDASGNKSIDVGFWDYGPTYSDWDEEFGVYRSLKTSSYSVFKGYTKYFRTPGVIGDLRLFTGNYPVGKIYVDDVSLKKVSYQMDAPIFSKSGTLEFIKYNGTDFFPIMIEGNLFRNETGGIEEIGLDEVYSYGFNTLSSSYSNYRDGDDRFKEVINIFYYFNASYQGGEDESWHNDSNQDLDGWVNISTLINTSNEDVLFFRVLDEVDNPFLGFSPPNVNPLIKIRNYIKDTRPNSYEFINFRGCYANSPDNCNNPWNGNFTDFIDDYLLNTDIASYTMNLPQAYIYNNSIPVMLYTAKSVSKTTPHSMVIAYGFGVPQWSTWDGVPGLHHNQYIPFNLQRFQIWNQIINGAIGVNFWGLNNYCYLYVNKAPFDDAVYCDYQTNQSFAITREIHSLYNVLIQPQYYDEWDVSNETIEIMMKKYENKIYLLSTSTTYDDVSDVLISLSPQYTLTSVTAINEIDNGDFENVYNRTITPINSTSFSDNFVGDNDVAKSLVSPGYATHIYEIEYS